MTPATPVTAAAPDGGRPFDPERRGLTIGLLLAVTLNALTALALVTIAPRIPAELGGLDLYGWLFSSYLLTSLVGTVWGGAEADRRGLRVPFATGLVLFAAGLLAAGVAPSMGWVIAARALQGFGAGTLTTCVYVAVTRAYPDAQRSRIMALLSTAWVTPALVGPALAGAVAEAFGWRWVFLGLVPVLGIVAVLTLPRFAPAPAHRPTGGPRALRLRSALAVVAGLGLALGALSAASAGASSDAASPAWRSAAIAGVGLGGAVAALVGLRRLMPAGTLRLTAGLGGLVAARGAFFAAFIGVEAFLALMLTELYGLSSAATGAIIATGAISWTAGSWWQARLDAGGAGAPGRGRRVVLGTLILGVGLGLQGVALAVVGQVGGVVVAALGWMTAGFGIGFAHATSSVLAFAFAESDGVEAGRVASALQLSDNVGAAISTGLGGAALAFATMAWVGDGPESLRAGIAAAFAVAGSIWWLSYVAGRRSARSAPAPSAPP